jgi:hypothetical protein
MRLVKAPTIGAQFVSPFLENPPQHSDVSMKRMYRNSSAGINQSTMTTAIGAPIYPTPIVGC